MWKIKNGFLIAILLFSFGAQSQCAYTLENYKNIDCYGANTGEIDIIIASGNTVEWIFPDGFTTNALHLQNLFAGQYYLTIMSAEDTCIDSLTLEQTIDISADFELSNMCSEYDSVDVKTIIWGGTPGYTYDWTGPNGFVSTVKDLTNLLPGVYILNIIDTNGCLSLPQQLDLINSVKEMNTFMSSTHVICKDDYSGSARVFVTEGSAPFNFQWSVDSSIIIEHDSFSVIEGLLPGEYRVKIIDVMGCITEDVVEVKSSPSVCITVYKAFSPNDDEIHEFWEIENIQLYPKALVQVYDRTGRQVFRRRNYINAEEYAFGGKDQQGVTLPSGTYYYIIDLENEDEVFKGALTIVR